MSKHKIWISVGAYVLTSVGSTALADVEQPASPPSALGKAIQLADAGGEGGEGGEAGAAVGLGENETLLTKILLMQGHLRVGKELADQGHWDVAAAHFMHPKAEIFESIEHQLETHGIENVEDIEEALEQLVERVTNEADHDGVQQSYAQTQNLLNAAAGRIKAELRTDALLEVFLALLEHADAEYRAAVDNGRFVNVAEYQDSRGFVWTAEALLGTMELEQRGADAYHKLLDHLTTLKQTWPSVVPPEKPVMSASEVAGMVSRIEFDMDGLRN